ncbi:T9SS type A sorting domain-containing protein [bacterium]|nr:T9SS type A sorting domain-containing protein [bacterium]
MFSHKWMIITTILLLAATSLFAQMGSVEGTVNFEDGAPAVEAMVTLSGVGGHHGGQHMTTLTNESGEFVFESVQPNTYTCIARIMMGGSASEVIDVLAGHTTYVELVLRSHGGGGSGSDSLTIVELSGTAIVEEANELHCADWYFLDVDDDGAADYRLGFGPPWYEPENGNTRPDDGDDITVTGGLLGTAEPPLVVVYELNGEFWREPFLGHGGHGGGWHSEHGCDPSDPVGIELTGIAIVHDSIGPHGDSTCYRIDIDDDQTADYNLDFGAPDYDPGNGATRPENGDEINIVGGMIDCPNAPLPWVIVYEINGLFWRVPGDTTGLGMTVSAIGEPIYPSTPTAHMIARNYPNPFNPTTTIDYSIPMAGKVTLVVYDIIGREVTLLVNNHQNAGSYSVNWNATALPSGIYFYRLSVGSQSITNRMLLIK